jgi:hypothetical protein
MEKVLPQKAQNLQGTKQELKDRTKQIIIE